MKQKFLKNGVCTVTALLLMMSALMPAANGAGAPEARPAVGSVRSPAANSSRSGVLPNTHLHQAVKPLVGKPVTKAEVSKTAGTKKVVKKPVARRWSYTEWATLHRGLGTVRGEVHSGSGSAMPSVPVALRSSKGKVLKVSARHLTHTSSSGTFVMRHVRIGSYRVRASKGKANGHVGVRVSGGRTSMAMIKM